MRLLLAGLILLAFPISEIWILIDLATRYGWWLLAYLLLMAVLGWRLIKDEQLLVFGRMAQAMSQGGTPGAAMFGSAKNILAGILLMIPGVISDAIAVILLLLPGGGKLPGRQSKWSGAAANDDVIEGEYRRED